MCPEEKINNQKEISIFDKISSYLRKNPLEFDFKDNIYNSESIFLNSIKSNFAGWYDIKDIKRQVGYILKICLLDKQDMILDVACGPGMHSIELAMRGYNVTGIDISDTLIAYLNKTLNYGAQFRKERMTEISEIEKYGLIIVLGNSLALMPMDECIKSLYQIYKAIKADGHIFLQIDNKKLFIEKEANTKNWNFYENRWLNISDHYFDSKRNLEITRDIGFDLTEKTIDEFVIVKRLYDPDEFIKILKSIGFLEIEYWGDWNNSPFNGSSPTLIIKARKKPKMACHF